MHKNASSTYDHFRTIGSQPQDYCFHQLIQVTTHYIFPSVYAIDCSYFHIASCVKYQPSSSLTYNMVVDDCLQNCPLASGPGMESTQMSVYLGWCQRGSVYTTKEKCVCFTATYRGKMGTTVYSVLTTVVTMDANVNLFLHLIHHMPARSLQM